MLIKQLRKNNESYNQISYLILANEPNITDDQTPYRNGFTKKKVWHNLPLWVDSWLSYMKLTIFLLKPLI